jgi:alkanesulfonate monooxygenase SsuD/methylene tetrahydromethanopterin reductase-like flavin-dependent oxidoreductase (luciferase family)
MVAHGGIIAGSPQTVRDEIERQAAELGFNYLLTYLFLGTMSLSDAMAFARTVPRRGDAARGEAVKLHPGAYAAAQPVRG